MFRQEVLDLWLLPGHPEAGKEVYLLDRKEMVPKAGS